jgi:hypothetical protein
MSQALIQTEPAPVSKVARVPPPLLPGAVCYGRGGGHRVQQAQLNGMTINSGASLSGSKSSRFLTSRPVTWALGYESFHCETHSLIQQPARD